MHINLTQTCNERGTSHCRCQIKDRDCCAVSPALPPHEHEHEHEPTAWHLEILHHTVPRGWHHSTRQIFVRQHLASCLALANKRAAATCVRGMSVCCTLHANIFSLDPRPSSYHQRPSACRDIFILSVTNFPPSCAGSLARRSPWHVFPGERGLAKTGFQSIEAQSPLDARCKGQQRAVCPRVSATSARGTQRSIRRTHGPIDEPGTCSFPTSFSNISLLRPVSDAIGEAGRPIHASCRRQRALCCINGSRFC
ncbi:hypothetical protein V8C35DRAFT_306489 [Trichoderma chlorosporum]